MTTTAESGPPPQVPAIHDDVIVDPRRRLLILAAMCVALVAVVASVSGLNVAQQALAADIDASQSQLLWIINGYTLALAALLMPVGAIGDRWGRKPVLMVGLVAFSLTNLASAFATEPNVLIALRVLAGVSAAMVMPVTLSVITTSFPREEQAKAIGTWAGFAGAGGIIGLFASAAIIDNATWPWVFALPIALAAVSFLLTAAYVPHSVEHTEAGFDIAGSLLSALAVGGLVLAFHEGPERGWTDAVTVAALSVGLLGAVAFEHRRCVPPALLALADLGHSAAVKHGSVGEQSQRVSVSSPEVHAIRGLVDPADVAREHDIARRGGAGHGVGEAHDAGPPLAPKQLEAPREEPRLAVRRHRVEQDQPPEFAACVAVAGEHVERLGLRRHGEDGHALEPAGAVETEALASRGVASRVVVR